MGKFQMKLMENKNELLRIIHPYVVVNAMNIHYTISQMQNCLSY